MAKNDSEIKWIYPVYVIGHFPLLFLEWFSVRFSENFVSYYKVDISNLYIGQKMLHISHKNRSPILIFFSNDIPCIIFSL